MALAISGLPKAIITHGAPNELAALRGRARNPVATSRNSSSPLTIRCTIPIKGGNADVLNEQVAVKPAIILGRSSFPPGFIFGVGSSAFQVEGEVEERGPCIWDTFCRMFPEKIADKSIGDVQIQGERNFKEDVELLKRMGVDSYRFSISWPRILPEGSLKGGVSRQGIQKYNNMINELLENGITPFVTLFHWDVPQALEDEYGGFLDRKIFDDFKDYCNICFNEFGDRVKHWVTVNEPWTFSSFGYGKGRHAPGRCSSIPSLGTNCPVGNTATEPYIVAHNLILAHAEAVKLYKQKFQDTQKGQIGITLVSHYYMPYDNIYQDQDAQARALDFHLGWFMDPLVYGDYPFNMRALVGKRLPYFSSEQSMMIKGSFDFIGLNYYTTRYARSLQIPENDSVIYNMNLLDSYVDTPGKKNGYPLGGKSVTWINVYPDGLRDLLKYIKQRYHDPPIYIHENGIMDVDNPELPLKERLTDPIRRDYLSGHLAAVLAAIKENVNVKGYFAWSFTDNFEWDSGYSQRFGLVFIDYENNVTRHQKGSYNWFTNFLSR